MKKIIIPQLIMLIIVLVCDLDGQVTKSFQDNYTRINKKGKVKSIYKVKTKKYMGTIEQIASQYLKDNKKNLVSIRNWMI